MKFEQFAKSAVPYGVTVEMNGDRWLRTGDGYMKIPKSLGSIGCVTQTDDVLDMILNRSDWGERFAELSDARLAKKDGRASDIIRTFFDGYDYIDIPNSMFGKIEKKDMRVIATFDNDEGEERHALLIGSPVADMDKFEPIGIILEL